MPGVTISAGYGAGGSAIAPQVATLLDLPLLDRAISSAVAAELNVTVGEAEGGATKRSPVGRFFSVLAPLAGGVLGAGTDAAPPDAESAPDDAAQFRERATAIMSKALETGAVILGRAGAASFRDRRDVLRVRLFGEADARIAQACSLEGTDEATARRRQPDVDRARAQYVRRLYGVDIDDPQFFDLQLNSTKLPLDACAELIASAYRSLVAAQAPAGQAGSV